MTKDSYISCNSHDQLHYIHKDHLGSFDVITDESGTVVEEYSFDAWGRRRNPTDWTYNNVATGYIYDRGYTGHEHLDLFGLINMNGRIYDPTLGRFLSADPIVQGAFGSSAYNSYSYVMNNPLLYTDPSGYAIPNEDLYYMKTGTGQYNTGMYSRYRKGRGGAWGSLEDGIRAMYNGYYNGCGQFIYYGNGGGGAGFGTGQLGYGYAGSMGYEYDKNSGQYRDKSTGDFVDNYTAVQDAVATNEGEAIYLDSKYSEASIAIIASAYNYMRSLETAGYPDMKISVTMALNNGVDASFNYNMFGDGSHLWSIGIWDAASIVTKSQVIRKNLINNLENDKNINDYEPNGITIIKNVCPSLPGKTPFGPMLTTHYSIKTKGSGSIKTTLTVRNNVTIKTQHNSDFGCGYTTIGASSGSITTYWGPGRLTLGITENALLIGLGTSTHGSDYEWTPSKLWWSLALAPMILTSPQPAPIIP